MFILNSIFCHYFKHIKMFFSIGKILKYSYVNTLLTLITDLKINFQRHLCNLHTNFNWQKLSLAMKNLTIAEFLNYFTRTNECLASLKNV